MRDKNRAPHNGPGREEFQAYLLGELSEEGKIAMESYLAENPMAQDALEGLKWVEKPKQVSKHISRIQRKTQERLNSRAIHNNPVAKRAFRVRPDIQFNPFVASMAGIAAVILVVFMILWLPDQRPENLAENHLIQSEQKPSAVPPSESAEIAANPAQAKSQKTDRRVADTPQSLNTIAEARKRSGPVQGTEREKSTLGEVFPGDLKKKRAKPPYPSLHLSYVFDMAKEDTPSQDANLLISETSVPVPLSSQVFLPNISSAPRKVNMGLSIREKKSSKARPAMAEESVSPHSIGDLDRIQPSPMSIRSQTYLTKPQREARKEDVQRTFKANMGIWYFTYERYREAERELFLLLSPDSEAYEQTDWAASSAGWYLSRIYLATGRHGEARRLLKEISIYPNPYQYQAQEVLQKL